MPPPVVNLSPRVLPRSVDPFGPQRQVQEALGLLAAREQREEDVELAEEEARREREFQREIERLRADVQRDVQGTFQERAGQAMEEIGRRGEIEMGLIGARGRQERLTVGTRGRQERLNIGARGELEEDLLTRRLDFEGEQAGMERDLRNTMSLREMNVGLAGINQRAQADRLRISGGVAGGDAFPLRGLAQSIAPRLFDPRSGMPAPTAENIRGLMRLSTGDPSGADMLFRQDSPPGQDGMSEGGLEGGLGNDPSGPGPMSFDLDVPTGVDVEQHLNFIGEFLQDPEQLDIYLNSLPPAERRAVENRLVP
ncbi:MAG: hypothetical protein ACOC5J_01675 [Gemmatimonadota bacterium]